MKFFKSTSEPVYSKEAIAARVGELAASIEADYGGKQLVLVGVLTGSFIFLADLARELSLDCEIDFIRVESYGEGLVTSGAPRITTLTKLDLTGKEVLVVDEIVDTGLTLRALVDHLSQSGAASVKVAALVDKKTHRRVDVTVDYTGFEIEDGFLVGYGLDAAEKRRNLPAIYLLSDR